MPFNPDQPRDEQGRWVDVPDLNNAKPYSDVPSHIDWDSDISLYRGTDNPNERIRLIGGGGPKGGPKNYTPSFQASKDFIGVHNALNNTKGGVIKQVSIKGYEYNPYGIGYLPNQKGEWHSFPEVKVSTKQARKARIIKRIK